MRKILNDVPVVQYGNPSAVCYIGSVMRLMAYIGDPVEQDELFALSGVGVCFPWAFASCCDEVGIIPEIPAHTFEALGYQSEYLTGEALRDKVACMNKIKRSIDAGRPVVGFGITVEAPMACLMIGYDDTGVYVRACQPPAGEPWDAEEPFYCADWFEKCAGLLFVGEKTGERLRGAAAYECIVKWARMFRSDTQSVTVKGTEIALGRFAFDRMAQWLTDDAQWENAPFSRQEQSLKQCGLLLLNHYRRQLYCYLKRLEEAYPGTVNPPVFAAIEKIGAAVPGAHTSDLWLHEAVDPALADFSSIRDSALREKVAAYVRMLGEYDDAVLWSLFLPRAATDDDTARLQCEEFLYRRLGKVRFIGVDAWRTKEEWSDLWARSGDFLPTLSAMLPKWGTPLTDPCAMMHHNGHEVDSENHYLVGYFFKADAPVPAGFDSYDVPTERAAYAVYRSDDFDGNLWSAYDRTRDRILADSVTIPYPHAYWHAEVYTDGPVHPGAYRFAYLFSVGE